MNNAVSSVKVKSKSLKVTSTLFTLPFRSVAKNALALVGVFPTLLKTTLRLLMLPDILLNKGAVSGPFTVYVLPLPITFTAQSVDCQVAKSMLKSFSSE